jgi:hypothetical protein
MKIWWCKMFHKASHIRMSWVYEEGSDTQWHCCKCGRDWNEG